MNGNTKMFRGFIKELTRPLNYFDIKKVLNKINQIRINKYIKKKEKEINDKYFKLNDIFKIKYNYKDKNDDYELAPEHEIIWEKTVMLNYYTNEHLNKYGNHNNNNFILNLIIETENELNNKLIKYQLPDIIDNYFPNIRDLVPTIISFIESEDEDSDSESEDED